MNHPCFVGELKEGSRSSTTGYSLAGLHFPFKMFSAPSKSFPFKIVFMLGRDSKQQVRYTCVCVCTFNQDLVFSMK